MSETHAFPLAWPAGWPRMKSGNRTRARFGAQNGIESYQRRRPLTVADAIARCRQVLNRMDCPDWNVIVSTNVALRNDGLPRSGQPEPNDPGAAVYFRKDGEDEKHRKVMAIDVYDRVADNLAAIAATLEALRAIERHGGGQILERAFIGFTALPPPISARHWTTILGVSALADREEIELAYKRRRTITHPDHGGNPEEFHEVERAYQEATA